MTTDGYVPESGSRIHLLPDECPYCEDVSAFREATEHDERLNRKVCNWCDVHAHHA